MAAAVGLHVRPCWTSCWTPIWVSAQDIECDKSPLGESPEEANSMDVTSAAEAELPGAAVASSAADDAAQQAEALAVAIQAFAEEGLVDVSELADGAVPDEAAPAQRVMEVNVSASRAGRSSSRAMGRQVQRVRPVLRSMRSAVQAEPALYRRRSGGASSVIPALHAPSPHGVAAE